MVLGNTSGHSLWAPCPGSPRASSAASRYRAVGRIHQASDGVGEDVEDMKSRERDSLEAV